MTLRRVQTDSFRLLLLGVSFLLLEGCGTPAVSPAEFADFKKQIIELQKAQGVQSARIDELNNKIMLMKDRIDQHSDNGSPESLNAAPIPTTVPPPVTAAPPPLPVTASATAPAAASGDQNSQASGPDKIYGQALQDARKPQLTFLERDVDLMLKNYRESPLTNNALFLLGETQFERGQFAQGATQFERLYKAYPDGNKAVAALYRLGLCYEKMGHANEAREAYQNVMTVYPGSAEAVDAEKRLRASGAKGP